MNDQNIAISTRPVWSASRLKTFLTCPRQFRYSYVDKVPSVPTSPLVFGRVLHETLCFAHERQMSERQFPPIGEVLEQFDGLWQRALDEEHPFFRPGAPTPEAHLTLAHELLRAFRAAPANQTPPLTVELAFEMEAGEHRLCGVIDRVDEGESGLVIVDFKSGARKPTPTELENELQFTIYAFAAAKVLGQPVSQVVHYHLRDGSHLPTKRSEEDFDWLVERLIPYVARAVEREEYPPRYGHWCNWCDYRELCQAQNQMTRRNAEIQISTENNITEEVSV